jgi:hypothetical protein
MKQILVRTLLIIGCVLILPLLLYRVFGSWVGGLPCVAIGIMILYSEVGREH